MDGRDSCAEEGRPNLLQVTLKLVTELYFILFCFFLCATGLVAKPEGDVASLLHEKANMTVRMLALLY